MAELLREPSISPSIYWMQRFIRTSHWRLKTAHVTSVKIISNPRIEKGETYKIIAQIHAPSKGGRDSYTTATFTLDQLCWFIEKESLE